MDVSDAATWERTDLPPDDPEVSEWFSSVVVHDGALLAVGTVGHGADGDAAVWRSDGEEWRRLDGEPMGGPGRQSAQRVVTNGRRVLVLGTETIEGETRARLWLGELGGEGEDAAEWRTVDGGTGGVFDTEADETVTDIAALGDGFVAVGYRYRDGTSHGLAWVSDDGDRWVRVEPTAPQPAQRWRLESVAVRDGAVVAGGTATAPGSGARAVTWTSDDGRTWSPPRSLPVSGDDRATPDGVWLDAVAATADAWAAVAGGWDPHVWTSTDGAAWSLLPSPSEDRFPAGVDLIDVDAHSSTLVAVGSGPSVLRYDGQGWAVTEGGPFPGVAPCRSPIMAEVSHHAWACAAGDDGWIAVGAVAAGDHEDAAVWTSPDGITWTRLEHDGFGGPGRQQARTVVAVPGGGWLVGGIDATHGDDDGALWRIHPDGQVTRRDGGEDALGGPGDQSIEDLVVVGEGLVAVGDDHGRIGLWESPVIDRPS